MFVEPRTLVDWNVITFASQHSELAFPGGGGGENPPGVLGERSSRSHVDRLTSSQAPAVPLKLRWNGGVAEPVPTLTYEFLVGIVTTQSV